MTEVIKIIVDAKDKASKELFGIKKAINTALGAASVTVLANFTLKLTMLASAAEEVNNKFNVVFKGVDKSIVRIDKLSKQTGFAVSSLQKMTSSLGDLIKPAGFAANEAFTLSERIVKLSLDLASFNNLEPANVVFDFQSALAGSSETLQKYGIDARETTLAQKAFNLGLINNIKQYERLDPVSKRQIRTIALIEKAYDDSADAIGDLSRTQDTFANQQRILQENFIKIGEKIGSILIPPITILLQHTNELLDDFENIYQSPIISFFEDWIPVLKKIAENISAQQLAQERANKILKETGNEWLHVNDRIDFGNKHLPNLTENTDNYTQANNELNDILKRLLDSNKDLDDQIDKGNKSRAKATELTKEWVNFNKKLQKEIDAPFKDFKVFEEGESPEEEIKKSEDLNKDLERINNEKRLKEEEDKRKRIAAFKQFQDDINIIASTGSQEAFAISKALAVAETTMKTWEAVQKSYTALAGIPIVGPALGTTAAAMALSAGLIRIANIKSQTLERREVGGGVSAGIPYTVGERGREAFIPQQDGFILSNKMLKQLGRGGNTYIINAMDAHTFQTFLRRGGNAVLANEMRTGRL